MTNTKRILRPATSAMLVTAMVMATLPTRYASAADEFNFDAPAQRQPERPSNESMAHSTPERFNMNRPNLGSLSSSDLIDRGYATRDEVDDIRNNMSSFFSSSDVKERSRNQYAVLVASHTELTRLLRQVRTARVMRAGAVVVAVSATAVVGASMVGRGGLYAMGRAIGLVGKGVTVTGEAVASAATFTGPKWIPGFLKDALKSTVGGSGKVITGTGKAVDVASQGVNIVGRGVQWVTLVGGAVIGAASVALYFYEGSEIEALIPELTATIAELETHMIDIREINGR